MIVERHYDDEALISLLASDRVHADAHLPSCSSCTAKLQSVRAIAGTLREASVWDTRRLPSQPSRTTIGNLRAFADRMTYEDSRAETYLRDLLEGPRETWMARLHSHPEWRTAGVVRKLIAAASRAVDTMPPDAVEMTAIATEIADNIDAGGYPSDTVGRFRGAAWRERSYALFYVGRFGEALDAVARADRYFSACLVDEYEHARLNVVRALVLRANEDLANAVAAARMSAESFQRFEDLSRIAAARLAEAQLLFTRREFDVAAALLIDLERRLRDSDDVDTHARVLVNLGYCSWQLGRLDDSLRYHDTAAVLFDELGVYTESIRIRWNVAAILQSSGRTEEAFSRFLSLRKTFLDLGMTSEAALVGLDLSELLLARGDFEAVEEICHTAMRAFETARISYTARALTALAYIHEAARFRTATPKLAKHVRQYLKKLPEDANVLFAPPAP